ncbi:hypothetical protein FNV43_RR16750 [Rhamnella rubrinervis]|uniref:Uncharacterized protein n=1 Tax=Rhamnella rubrinervis TaxID=2594499 RepID=A0A8K0GZC1_9ROSA|nr:hypothetical protein FNV43_RR16750 [Rhamnella rubrinervis]
MIQSLTTNRQVEEPVVEPSSKRLGTSIGLASFLGVVCRDNAAPLSNGGQCYVKTYRLKQFHIDHHYEMYHWYMDQFKENPCEQLAMANHMATLGIMVLPTIVVSSDNENPKEHLDPEDEDPWDYPGSD